MADFWLTEKQLVHKLFKVLVPRFQHCNVSYTRMLKAPKPYPGDTYQRAVLELRGNPFPPLVPDANHNRNLIHNVLLDEAKKAYRAEKYAQIAAKIEEAEGSPSGSQVVEKQFLQPEKGEKESCQSHEIASEGNNVKTGSDKINSETNKS